MIISGLFGAVVIVSTVFFAFEYFVSTLRTFQLQLNGDKVKMRVLMIFVGCWLS